MTKDTHDYRLALTWDERGPGTIDYRSYSRAYRIAIDGKPELVGSADPTFRGDPKLPNPEELLVAALSSCHMLSYLALCARAGIDVLAYADAATGRMSDRFEEVVLRPRVAIAVGGDRELARALHERAHATCFIARSCSFPIRCEPEIEELARAPVPAQARRDVAVRLPDGPDALARLGEALGGAGVSVEGGGAFGGVAHVLVADADRAVAALRAAGLEVLAVSEVVTARLDQERPGQLGAIGRVLADAGVAVGSFYSDHEHQLILGVADPAAGRACVDTYNKLYNGAWSRTSSASSGT